MDHPRGSIKRSEVQLLASLVSVLSASITSSASYHQPPKIIMKFLVSLLFVAAVAYAGETELVREKRGVFFADAPYAYAPAAYHHAYAAPAFAPAAYHHAYAAPAFAPAAYATAYAAPAPVVAAAPAPVAVAAPRSSIIQANPGSYSELTHFY
ncbi:unnamed protein product [Bemisia tabaci]|uniref:Uncharacterized protein n=1 Tax=Bemisia tabaci TaxID=7038 RepID=A0A9P0EXT6_BEMTA|nr:unnamed protein product [Bemisia tabaci]